MPQNNQTRETQSSLENLPPAPQETGHGYGGTILLLANTLLINRRSSAPKTYSNCCIYSRKIGARLYSSVPKEALSPQSSKLEVGFAMKTAQ